MRTGFLMKTMNHLREQLVSEPTPSPNPNLIQTINDVDVCKLRVIEKKR